MRKLQRSKLTFSKILAIKRFPKILGDFSKGKNPLKMGNYTIFWMFDNPRRDQASNKFYNKCSENSRSQIVFRTDIFRKLTLGAPGKWPYINEIDSNWLNGGLRNPIMQFTIDPCLISGFKNSRLLAYAPYPLTGNNRPVDEESRNSLLNFFKATLQFDVT